MRLLLDTCTFLWLASGSAELSGKATALFKDTGNAVYLSSVSVWEIAVKNSLGKLPLPEPPEYFVAQQRRQHLIEPLSLHEQAVYRLPTLPNLHRDPFDKMLVCQALEHGLTILTSDKLITQYPVDTIW
jgi:PIN domain nuclease of toxin-antitoxin system